MGNEGRNLAEEEQAQGRGRFASDVTISPHWPVPNRDRLVEKSTIATQDAIGALPRSGVIEPPPALLKAGDT